MKKMFTIITLLVTLVFANVADAKFSDEYKKAHPKNVVTKTRQLPSGRMSTTTDYTVFKKKSDGLTLMVSDLNGVKICHLIFVKGGKRWNDYYKLSWGDGEFAHSNPTLMRYQRPSHGFIAEVIITAVNPAELKDAIVIHAHSELHGAEVVLNEKHKRWKEWKEALDIAQKLMTEKS